MIISGTLAILGIHQNIIRQIFGVNCFTNIFSLQNFVSYGIANSLWTENRITLVN